MRISKKFGVRRESGEGRGNREMKKFGRLLESEKNEEERQK